MPNYGRYRGARRYTRRARPRTVYDYQGNPYNLYRGKINQVGSLVDQFGKSYKAATFDQRQARRAHRFRGRGDYKDVWNKVKRFVPRAIGGAAGALITKSPQGALAGWNKGADFSRTYLGWGDYGPPVTNQIIDTQGGQQPISVNQAEGDLTGDVYINHREFVTNINATTSSFENRSYGINPGLSKLFPFLSQVAVNFTMFEFQGLIFEYRPTSGETGVGSNALGKVIMAVDYDPNAEPFTNAIQMENYDYAISTKPSVEAILGVETAPNQQALKMQFVRSGQATRDKIFTDIGLLQIATEGIPNAGIVGELWVTYRIKLSRAQLHQSGGLGLQQHQSLYRLFANTTMTDDSKTIATAYPGQWAVPPAAKLGSAYTSAAPRIGNVLDCLVESNSVNVLQVRFQREGLFAVFVGMEDVNNNHLLSVSAVNGAELNNGSTGSVAFPDWNQTAGPNVAGVTTLALSSNCWIIIKCPAVSNTAANLLPGMQLTFAGTLDPGHGATLFATMLNTDLVSVS